MRGRRRNNGVLEQFLDLFNLLTKRFNPVEAVFPSSCVLAIDPLNLSLQLRRFAVDSLQNHLAVVFDGLPHVCPAFQWACVNADGT